MGLGLGVGFKARIGRYAWDNLGIKVKVSVVSWVGGLPRNQLRMLMVML